MFKCSIIIFVILSITKLIASVAYNRTLLQGKFPGFGEDWIVVDEQDGKEVIGYFRLPEGRQIDLAPEPEDVVKFTLFTRDNPKGININSDENLHKYYNATKPTKFVTHGWLSGGDRDSCTLIRNGFLHKYDANVIVMDWHEISKNPFYPIPMHATQKVGQFYGKFLQKLIDAGGDPKQFHLVGHSLGAHVSGFAARSLKCHRVGRVTGLDPARPGFTDLHLVDGLRNNDSEFVDIIHTCSGYLGVQISIGDVDFYPNGGQPPQPGCEDVLKMAEACSHGRSYRYFAQSLIEKRQFMAFPCDSLDLLKKGKCEKNGVPMGDAASTEARGVHYLLTDSKAPFIMDPESYRIDD